MSRVDQIETGRLFSESAFVQHAPRIIGEPAARSHDPAPSHLAAARVKPSRRALVDAIRWTLHGCEPATAFEIAAAIEKSHPGRWDEGTVRTAVSAAGLRCVDMNGVSPRGSRCSRYAL